MLKNLVYTYNVPSCSDLSEKSIRAELAQEDASFLHCGWTTLSKEGATMSQIIIMGLDLEEEQ